MKKKLFILAFLLCALTLISDYAIADFYVIAGGRRVGTEIKSLPYTISSSGFYYIAKDLSCAVGSHGISINVDNVTLDLMGFSLVGPGGETNADGIYMNTRTNVEIRNGTVRNFPKYGIYEGNTGGTGHRIINIRVNNNGNTGIFLLGKINIVERCTAVGNGHDGICAGDGSTITGNTCYNNQDDGIHAGEGSTVTGNTCRSNSDHGILLAGYNLVDQNTATGNGDTNMNHLGTCVFGANCAP